MAESRDGAFGFSFVARRVCESSGEACPCVADYRKLAGLSLNLTRSVKNIPSSSSERCRGIRKAIGEWSCSAVFVIRVESDLERDLRTPHGLAICLTHPKFLITSESVSINLFLTETAIGEDLVSRFESDVHQFICRCEIYIQKNKPSCPFGSNSLNTNRPLASCFVITS